MNDIWVVVPAAGIGSRMGSQAKAKQYLPLLDTTVLEQTIATLLQISGLQKIILALHPDDTDWSKSRYATHPNIRIVTGGTQRADSVLAGLRYLSKQQLDPQSWVLVHDAARPCVRLADIELLITSCATDAIGGLLAIPVQDSMKRADDTNHAVAHTVPREQLWHALTPQLFRLQPLQTALENALQAKLNITDESSAMELAGHAPVLVAGHRDNIKITQPDDLALAAFYLSQRTSI
jgi:2-C-methyl-D-erythritol 4-phosphate cytidylyltransferase